MNQATKDMYTVVKFQIYHCCAENAKCYFK